MYTDTEIKTIKRVKFHTHKNTSHWKHIQINIYKFPFIVYFLYILSNFGILKIKTYHFAESANICQVKALMDFTKMVLNCNRVFYL